MLGGNGFTGQALVANYLLEPTNQAFPDRHRLIQEQPFNTSEGVEGEVWIGAGCLLLDGSILRKGSVIGAMSLVRGEVQAFSIQVGNPLNLIGWRK